MNKDRIVIYGESMSSMNKEAVKGKLSAIYR